MWNNRGMAIVFSEVLRRTYRRMAEDELLNHAAQVAFYFTFSLFPLLLFLTTVFGLVMNQDAALRSELFAYLQKVMPSAAFGLLQSTITEVASEWSGGKLTVGLLIALWSASAGVDSLRVSLNASYGIKETRSLLHVKVNSILLTLLLGVLLVLTMSLIFYGSELLHWLIPGLGETLTSALSYAILLTSLLLGFAIVYNAVPNHPTFPWQWFSPGAFTGIALWLLFSYGFRLYLSFFDRYARTYGSLGAVIILLLWLYLTATVVLVGGTINAVVRDLRKENDLSSNKV